MDGVRTINKQQARAEALSRVAALIRVQIADGDLYTGLEPDSDEQQEVAAACEEIADTLAQEARKLERRLRRPKAKYAPGATVQRLDDPDDRRVYTVRRREWVEWYVAWRYVVSDGVSRPSVYSEHELREA